MRTSPFAPRFRLATLAVALLVGMPALTPAAGIPLLDATGASGGSARVQLSRGKVRLKVTGLAPAPADVTDGTATFTAYVYKAYLTSSTDPAVEVFLADVYPNGKGRAVAKVALRGDLSRLGLDRVAITAFSKDAQQSGDVLTATLAP